MKLPSQALELRIVVQAHAAQNGRTGHPPLLRLGFRQLKLEAHGGNGTQVSAHGDRRFAALDAMQRDPRHARRLGSRCGGDLVQFPLRANTLAQGYQLGGKDVADGGGFGGHCDSHFRQILQFA